MTLHTVNGNGWYGYHTWNCHGHNLAPGGPGSPVTQCTCMTCGIVASGYVVGHSLQWYTVVLIGMVGVVNGNIVPSSKYGKNH